jgi:hypothetical protein
VAAIKKNEIELAVMGKDVEQTGTKQTSTGRKMQHE